MNPRRLEVGRKRSLKRKEKGEGEGERMRREKRKPRGPKVNNTLWTF